jgi:hypothetical protein
MKAILLLALGLCLITDPPDGTEFRLTDGYSANVRVTVLADDGATAELWLPENGVQYQVGLANDVWSYQLAPGSYEYYAVCWGKGRPVRSERVRITVVEER